MTNRSSLLAVAAELQAIQDPVAQILIAEKLQQGLATLAPKPVRRVELLTDATIREYANMSSTRGEREFNRARAERIRKWYTSGTFKGADFAHIFVKSTGTKTRVNGQHTSKVLLAYREANPDEPLLPLEVTIDEWVVEDQAGADKWSTYIFSTYDRQDSSRTHGETISASVKNNPIKGALFVDVRPLVIQALAGGLARYYAEQERKRGIKVNRTNFDKADLVLEYSDFSLAFAPLLEQPKFKQQAVVTAMYGSFIEDQTKNKSADKAITFWTEVVMPGVVRHTQADKLRTTLLKSTSASNSGRDMNKIETTCLRHWRTYLSSI